MNDQATEPTPGLSGSSNKQVALALGVGIKTVEKHRQHVMDKLDIHETAGLTRDAIAAGFIPLL
jgi:DNA-binding NarL/FixJ family response regulator